jgi:hypothetical protein
MSTKSYQSEVGELTVRPVPTVSRSGGTNAVAVIGGYNKSTANASVTAGEATAVTNPVDASEQFGDSEIARVSAVLTANGANDIRAVPVPETEMTESVTGSDSITLSHAPIFDPQLHPEHDVVVTDTASGTSLSINYVYTDPVQSPTSSDTANVNPVTGEVVMDASGDYEVTYTYGDYQTAIDTAKNLPVRYLCVLTENEGVKASAITAVADIASDFDFKRVVTGARPEIQSTDVGSYVPSQRSWRMVEVAPARAGGANGPVRTQAAVAGLMASQSIGPDGSTLFDTVSGLTGVNTEYRASTATGFDGVTSLTRNGKIVQAITTSESAQFQNVYATEIIDRLALDLFSVAESYAGGPQDIGDLQSLLRSVCQSATNETPPLLGFAREVDARPYDVEVSIGADSGITNASVTIVPSPIAEEVNINLTVADGFVSFGTAE